MAPLVRRGDTPLSLNPYNPWRASFFPPRILRIRVKIVETGETIQMTSPDQVLLSGVLQSGAVASVHIKGGTANGTGFLFEIHGTEGDLAIASTETSPGD
jgi:hypothetical protein